MNRTEHTECMKRETTSTTNWYSLDTNLLELIFKQYLQVIRTCWNPNQFILKCLLPLREVNKTFQAVVNSIVFKILTPQINDEPSEEYLEKFGEAWKSFYFKSPQDSKNFLKSFLYYNDCKSKYVIDAAWNFKPDDGETIPTTKYAKTHLEKLNQFFLNPCRWLEVDSVDFLDLYRKDLEQKGISFKPLGLKCNLFHDPALCLATVTAADKQNHYQKMELLLAENMLSLSISLHSQDFCDITSIEHFRGKEFSSIEKLLFGKTLIQLSSFELRLGTDDGGTDWDENISMCAADVNALERLTPNLRSLSFDEISIKKCFIKAFVNSPLIKNLESLIFPHCVFEDRESLELLLQSPNLSNLKQLQFPDFELGDNDNDVASAIKKLASNDVLVNLEELIVTDNHLDASTAEALLFVIENNPSLINLKRIQNLEESIYIGSGEDPLPNEIFDRIKETEHLKENFDFSCIAQLFED